jgi:isoaspartyl peptidase/L-asparaginase-like protein (Ntn-hydrolase superfamily)
LTRIALAIHGGAGNVQRDTLDSIHAAACRAALTATLAAGYEILQHGGSAVDAVELAVKMLEDYEEFNAGRGSVLTAAGGVEMDAAIMDGSGRRAGAVAGVRCIKNPVCAARAVMEHSPHLLLIGEGAENYARAQGIEFASTAYFITSRRRALLEQANADAYMGLDHEDDKHGTVGAVACDTQGHIAAATSTGGMINKLAGRVGDSPLIGAGTWADNTTCAVSATGHGESFIRTAFAHEVDALMRYKNFDLHTACKNALDQVLALGFDGGCIAVDAAGNVVLPFNTTAMHRGAVGSDGNLCIAIFADEILM